MPTCAAICSTPTPVIQISLLQILLASFRITHFSTSETFASDSEQFFGSEEGFHLNFTPEKDKFLRYFLFYDFKNL